MMDTKTDLTTPSKSSEQLSKIALSSEVSSNETKFPSQPSTTRYKLEIRQRHRDNLVGKRVLCISKTFNVPGLNPAQLSSSLWSTLNLNAASNACQEALESLTWCPAHHHHQPSQQQILARIRDESAFYDSTGNEQLIKRNNNKSRRLINQNTSNSLSYSVLKTICQKAKNAALSSALTSTSTSTSNPTEDKHLADCDEKNPHLDCSIFTTMKLKCELCANVEAQDGYERYLSSLPWRIGTIRAVSHRDLRDPALSLLIEFDLLDWQTRDWYQVRDNQDQEGSSNNAEEKVQNKNLGGGSFAVLLVENSICCATRSQTPLGKGKLWPALVGRIFFFSMCERKVMRSDDDLWEPDSDTNQAALDRGSGFLLGQKIWKMFPYHCLTGIFPLVTMSVILAVLHLEKFYWW